MAYAKILVPLTGSPDDSLALATAFAAGAPFKSHVEAFFVHPNPREVTAYVYSGVPVSPNLVQSIIDGQVKLANEAQAAARSALTTTAKDAGATIIGAPVRGEGLTCSFHTRYGFIPHLIAEAARLSDLVVFKAVDGSERHELATAFIETLTHASRPVLLPPQKPISSFGRNVAIGWDGRDSAARAVTAALPFLKQAKRVEILTVGAHESRHSSRVDALKEYLGLHGITATSVALAQDDKTVGGCLMDYAAKSNIDLVVMGGYGHSHLREVLAGGVTLDIVSEHAVPVFLMH